MPPELFNAIPEAIRSVQSMLQFWIAVIIILVVAAVSVLGAWFTRVDRDNKKVIAANKATEEEAAKNRVQEYKGEISGLSMRLDSRIDRVESKVDAHIIEDEKRDTKMQDCLNKFDAKIDRLGDKLGDHMNKIDVHIGSLDAKLEMRETERLRHEYHE